MTNSTTAALLAALSGIGVAASAAPANAQRIDLVNRTALRVCADPANMPFSNDQGEGFENRVAAIIAGELKIPVEYTWFPQCDRIHPPDARRQALRRGDGLRPGR